MFQRPERAAVRGSIKRWAGTIDEFVTRELQSNLQRPVINSTGLEGNYEWEMAFGSRPDVPNIFTALEDQLGLILDERMGPWEVIVIDDVRMPTPN
jgi:uncharacterized protein (TIGR03435 family)